MKKNAEYKLLYIKRRLFQTKVNVTGIISNGSVHSVPRQKVISRIKREISYITNKVGLNQSEANLLYQQSLSQLDTIMKSTGRKLRAIDAKFGGKEHYQENLMQRQSVVAHTVQKSYIGNSRLIQDMNLVAYQVEQRMKSTELEKLLSDSYSRASYSPFFLASAHPHPAKDHAAWEGKIYVDADWAAHVRDDQDRARIAAYIRNRGIRTVQWVTGPPVYLINRPNCKHYLTNIPLDEVLHSSTKSLLRRHKMYMAEEVPITNATRAYRAYYDRLKTQLELQKVAPSAELTKEIKKTRILLSKWTRILNQEKQAR